MERQLWQRVLNRPVKKAPVPTCVPISNPKWLTPHSLWDSLLVPSLVESMSICAALVWTSSSRAISQANRWVNFTSIMIFHVALYFHYFINFPDDCSSDQHRQRLGCEPVRHRYPRRWRGNLRQGMLFPVGRSQHRLGWSIRRRIFRKSVLRTSLCPSGRMQVPVRIHGGSLQSSCILRASGLSFWNRFSYWLQLFVIHLSRFSLWPSK